VRVNAAQKTAVAAPAQASVSLGSTLVHLLASVKFAVLLVAIIAAACIAGTVLPQGQEAVDYLRKYPEAVDRIDFFNRLGLTHIFSSWWFLGLLSVLAASIMTCSTRRFATLKRTSGYAWRRAAGSMLTHISLLLVLTGGVIRGVWAQKGFIELRQGQIVADFNGEQGSAKLPFAISLSKFQIERDDAVVNRTAAAPAGMNAAPVKNFRSTVQLLEGGSVVSTATIAVNKPLKHRGYTFYQTGYDPDDMTWTSLEVVRDPGVPVVFTGFAFLIGGLFLVFYLNPWIEARKKIA
jgi:cytochrome c biogenesis protein ResB